MMQTDYGRPTSPIPEKEPDIQILGWVVTTEPDDDLGQPPSVGIASSDPATWPDDFDATKDHLLNALYGHGGRRVVIDIRFVD